MQSSSRPKQSVPAEIVQDLMRAIQNQFYPDSFCDKKAAKQWGQDSNFIRLRVVLWPASWLNKRGVTLKPIRYKQIILEVLNEIKAHGQTGVIKYWPGYLAKCIQERFKYRSEEIYQEGKNLRALTENTLASLGSINHSGPDPIRVLAEARNDLLKTKKKPSKQAPKQLDLL